MGEGEPVALLASGGMVEATHHSGKKALLLCPSFYHRVFPHLYLLLCCRFGTGGDFRDLKLRR